MAPLPRLSPRTTPPSIAIDAAQETATEEVRRPSSLSPVLAPATPESPARPQHLAPPQRAHVAPGSPGTPQTLAVPVVMSRRPSRSSVSSMAPLPPPLFPLFAASEASAQSAQSVQSVPSIHEVLSINEIRIAVPPMAGAVVGTAGAHAAKFDAFAEFVTRVVGHPASFYASVVVVVGWLAIGAIPALKWGNTWQLILNSISSGVTFMGLFVLQAAMNRGARLQAVRDMDTRNLITGLEQQLHVVQNTLDHMVDVQNKQQKMLEALLRAQGIDEAAL